MKMFKTISCLLTIILVYIDSEAQVITFEAEDGVLLASADVRDPAGCSNVSGSGFVRYNQSATANTTHAVTVPSADDYIMVLTFFSGSGSTTYLEYSVDGTNYNEITFSGIGFCYEAAPNTVEEAISLPVGAQTVYFRRPAGKTPPLLDHVEIWSAIESITVASEGEVTTLEAFSALQMEATVLPAANILPVEWSVVNGTGIAYINEDGVLTPSQAGTITVRAMSSGMVGEQVLIVTENNEQNLVYRAEAEYVEILGGAVVNGGTCTNVSGAGWAKYSDSDFARTVHSDIIAPFTGDFTLKIHFFSPGATALASKIALSTDGTDYSNVLSFDAAFACDDEGVEAADSKEFTVALVAGPNTLYFRNAQIGEAEPLIDYIEVIDPTVYVHALTISSAGDVNELAISATLQMSVDVLPVDATDESVTWSVEDDTYATISVEGLLTGVADGIAVVTATANDGSEETDTFEVLIGNPTILTENIEVSSAAGTSINLGTTSQMSVAVLPGFTSDKSVTWSITPGTGSAEIDTDGLLTGSTAGIVTVVATANDGSSITGSLEITLVNQTVLVTEIHVSSDAGTTVETDQNLQLEAEILPINATSTSPVWSVVNGTGEATISQNGLLTSIKSGTVTVKATADDALAVEGTLEIVIVDPVSLVTQITITSPAGESIDIGQTSQLTATITPTNATDATVVWSVRQDTGEATIDQSGLLTGLSAGMITVLATASDASATVGELEIEVNTAAILGLQPIQKAQLVIYPNPVTHAFKVDADHIDIRSIELINLNGEVVLKTTETNEAIAVADLPNATYIVSAVTSAGDIHFFRIKKQ